MCISQAAVQDTLNEQEGVPSLFNPPPPRPLQVNTADHRVYSYIVSRPQPRVSLEHFNFLMSVNDDQHDFIIVHGVLVLGQILGEYMNKILHVNPSTAVFTLSNCLNCFILQWLFTGITRMELLLDNATFQIYILHSSGHIQVIWVK